MASEHSPTGGPVWFKSFRAPGPATAVPPRSSDGRVPVGGPAVETATAAAASGPVQSREGAVREVVGRHRPAVPLGGIRPGDDVPSVGMASPSGSTIAVTPAGVLAPYPASIVDCYVPAPALEVASVRMYAGARLPLDFASGAAGGVAVGSTVNPIAGIFRPRPAEMGPANG